jgi:hypothetical protein
VAATVDQLTELPDAWALVAVGNDKRPYQPEWQKNPLTKQQLQSELASGRAVAVGVLAGPQSGGLLFVDHDGLGASEVLESLGTSLRELPKSWAVTSGRDARLQIIYSVPRGFWDQIKTTKLKSSIKGEQLELRWAGCQSIVLGKHPLTGSYRWLKDRSPSDLPLADAPSVLLQQMHRVPEPLPLIHNANPVEDAERARSYLDRIPSSLSDDYDEWVKVGMALHSVGDDTLLHDWIQWSAASGKFQAGECEHKWATFKPNAGGIGLGTLYHLAGGITPRQVAVNAIKAVLGSDHPKAAAFETPGSKAIKLEVDELLALIRQQQGDRLRYNIYTQAIELDGKPLQNLEHHYLELALAGVKVSKELAADAVVYVARENQYDPVREYLDRVSDDVPLIPIDTLATAYLRPHDQPGTLYDAMLRCTLIAAVRRVYEPGAKHDSACVLMGPQGCGKSTFWRNLGGPFFSDALADVSSKDDLMVLHRSWLMEYGELDFLTGRRHAGQVKAFLSQQVDTFPRALWQGHRGLPLGVASSVGSTNRDSGFLVDDTGNRRFWVIPVTAAPHIPVDGLLLERDAIWSAAVAAYKPVSPTTCPVPWSSR